MEKKEIMHLFICSFEILSHKNDKDYEIYTKSNNILVILFLRKRINYENCAILVTFFNKLIAFYF